MKTFAFNRFSAALVVSLTVVGAANAEWLEESDVRAAAAAFSERDPIGSTVLKGCSLKSLEARDRLWIACYEPSGYAVFSGSDLVGPVVAFSDKNFAEPHEGDAFYDILAGASAGCTAAESEGETADGLRRRAKWQKLKPVGKTRALLKSKHDEAPESVFAAPFMTEHWNQWQPYNDFSPVHGAAPKAGRESYRGRVPCGCIATATAQVFDYWKWPVRIDEVRTYNHYFSNEVAGVTRVGAYATRFDGNVPIDWSAFNDTYESYSHGGYDLRGNVAETNRYHIARLVHLCDSIAEMKFAADGSSANFDTVVRNSPWYAGGICYNLDYTAEYSVATNAARADIQAGCPVLVSIPGHAVVGHGWSEDGEGTSYIYLNYGWGGSNDGWYNFDDRASSSSIKMMWTSFKPRAKPQLDPLPKVCGDSITLRWHFPDCYTNDLTGFTVCMQRIGSGTPEDLEDLSDDFSAPTGVSSSPVDIVVRESDLVGDDGCVLSNDYAASGTYEFPTACTLTSASVLTLKIASYAAIAATLEVQMSIDGGEWTTVATPLINEGFSPAEWETVRVYLGGNGGKTARFRFLKRWGGRYYIDDDGNRDDCGYVLLDDFRVTSVLKPDTPMTILIEDPSSREYTFPDSYVKIQPGASYMFSVKPNMSSTSVEGEMSDTVMTTIAGQRTMPLPGEETYSDTSLSFSASDVSGVWSFSGTQFADATIGDCWYCSVSAAISGKLMQNSELTFGWSANNYYGDYNGDEAYGVLSAVFVASDGTQTSLTNIVNPVSTASTSAVLSLAAFAGMSGKVCLSYLHYVANYNDDNHGTRFYAPRVSNVRVPSVPEVSWTNVTVTASAAPTIDAVTHSTSQVVDGLFVECSMGTNVFIVECSPSVVSMDAHVSAASYVPDSAVEVHALGGGYFVVEICGNGIPDWAERTRAILTLAATDSNGTTTYKDLSLRFSDETTSDSYVSGDSDSIPSIAADASPADVTNAINTANFANPEGVKAVIGGSAAKYCKFKGWAGTVKGTSGAAFAGEAAVVGNTNAAAAYLLGAKRLFDNAPKIVFEELEVDAGADDGSGNIFVGITVKDGEEPVACDDKKVADMFEATSDIGDWDGPAKLTPTVESLGVSDGVMRFGVTPGTSTPKAFLRIRK